MCEIEYKKQLNTKEIRPVCQLHKSKGLCLYGSEQSGPQNGLAGVEGDIESGDARVGSWQVLVVRGADGHTG